MPPPTATTLSQAFAKFRSSLTHTLLLCVFVAVATGAGANLDSTGKKVTFYPSSLMIAHDARPLVFYSETKLLNLVTKLKAIPPRDASSNSK